MVIAINANANSTQFLVELGVRMYLILGGRGEYPNSGKFYEKLGDVCVSIFSDNHCRNMDGYAGPF